MEELENDGIQKNEESFPLKKSNRPPILKRIMIAVLGILLVVFILVGISKLVSVIKSGSSGEREKKPKLALKTVKLDEFKYSLIDSEANVVANLNFELVLGYSGQRNEHFEKEIGERKEQIKDVVYFVVSQFKPRDLYLMREIPDDLFEAHALEKSREENQRILQEYYVKPRNKNFYRLKEKLEDSEIRKLLDIFELTALERNFFFKETVRRKILESLNAIFLTGKANEIYFIKFNAVVS